MADKVVDNDDDDDACHESFFSDWLAFRKHHMPANFDHAHVRKRALSERTFSRLRSQFVLERVQQHPLYSHVVPACRKKLLARDSSRDGSAVAVAAVPCPQEANLGRRASEYMAQEMWMFSVVYRQAVSRNNRHLEEEEGDDEDEDEDEDEDKDEDEDDDTNDKKLKAKVIKKQAKDQKDVAVEKEIPADGKLRGVLPEKAKQAVNEKDAQKHHENQEIELSSKVDKLSVTEVGDVQAEVSDLK